MTVKDTDKFEVLNVSTAALTYPNLKQSQNGRYIDCLLPKMGQRGHIDYQHLHVACKYQSVVNAG